VTDHPSPSGKLIVSRDGPVITVTLNRPEVHNALDRQVSAERRTILNP
jgi:enoyl-CoA hydratase/carnithine racemase